MPSSRKGSRRADRCVYVEGGRRCPRDGLPGSDPSMCRPHMVLFETIARSQQAQPSPLVSVLGDLLNGQRVSRDRVREAAAELFGRFAAGGMAEGYYPAVGPEPQHQRVWDWLNQGAQRARQRPQQQPDPEVYERQQMAAIRAEARRVLGFAVGQRLSEQEVQRRRRELAMKHHPDRGGDPEKMTAVNAAADILVAEVQA